MFKNSSETTYRKRVVSLHRWKHYNVISVVGKSADQGKLLSICFYNNSDSF